MWLNQFPDKLRALCDFIEAPFQKYFSSKKMEIVLKIIVYSTTRNQEWQVNKSTKEADIFPQPDFNTAENPNNTPSNRPNQRNNRRTRKKKKKGSSVLNLSLFGKTSTGAVLFYDCLKPGGFKKKEYVSKFLEKFWKGCCQQMSSEFCLDEHHADQVLLYCALAEGTSKIRLAPLSLHSQAVLALLRTFLNCQIKVNQEGNGVILRIEGIAFQ